VNKKLFIDIDGTMLSSNGAINDYICSTTFFYLVERELLIFTGKVS